MALTRKNFTRKKQALPEKFHVKKGDTVMVISGRDKGKTGTIRQVDRKRGKVIVEGVNMVKKAVRPNPFAGTRGGHVEMEAPLPVSKVMVYDLKNDKPTRVRREEVGGKRIRVAVKSGEHLDV